MDSTERPNEYDSEPVRYCARCFSLKVKYDESIDSEYCAECGSSDILEAPIEEWEKRYERRYRHKYTVKEADPKKTFVFQMPLEKLKAKIYESTRWRDIIKAMYPSFPWCYGKADSIILFFDTIVKQNKIEELKLLLHKKFKF